MGARASSLVLGGLLLAAAACGGGRDGERFELYHLESAIGPPGVNGELRCGPPRPQCPGVLERPPTRVFRYRVRGRAAVTGDEIDRKTVQRVAAAAEEAPALRVALTPEGRRAFARLTKEVARIGERDLGWHHVAIVVGDEIVDFPEVDFDVYPNGFADARTIRIVAASDADADELVERLRGD